MVQQRSTDAQRRDARPARGRPQQKAGRGCGPGSRPEPSKSKKELLEELNRQAEENTRILEREKAALQALTAKAKSSCSTSTYAPDMPLPSGPPSVNHKPPLPAKAPLKGLRVPIKDKETDLDTCRAQGSGGQSASVGPHPPSPFANFPESPVCTPGCGSTFPDESPHFTPGMVFDVPVGMSLEQLEVAITGRAPLDPPAAQGLQARGEPGWQGEVQEENQWHSQGSHQDGVSGAHQGHKSPNCGGDDEDPSLQAPHRAPNGFLTGLAELRAGPSEEQRRRAEQQRQQLQRDLAEQVRQKNEEKARQRVKELEEERREEERMRASQAHGIDPSPVGEAPRQRGPNTGEPSSMKEATPKPAATPPPPLPPPRRRAKHIIDASWLDQVPSPPAPTSSVCPPAHAPHLLDSDPSSPRTTGPTSQGPLTKSRSLGEYPQPPDTLPPIIQGAPGNPQEPRGRWGMRQGPGCEATGRDSAKELQEVAEMMRHLQAEQERLQSEFTKQADLLARLQAGTEASQQEQETAWQDVRRVRQQLEQPDSLDMFIVESCLLPKEVNVIPDLFDDSSVHFSCCLPNALRVGDDNDLEDRVQNQADSLDKLQRDLDSFTFNPRASDTADPFSTVHVFEEKCSQDDDRGGAARGIRGGKAIGQRAPHPPTSAARLTGGPKDKVILGGEATQPTKTNSRAAARTGVPTHQSSKIPQPRGQVPSVRKRVPGPAR